MHAYINGSVPGGVTILKSIGNTNKVHKVIWTKGAAQTAGRAKWSSMFPKPMPRGIVCYFLQEANNSSGNPATIGGSQVGQKPGTGWSNISIETRGNTMFPIGGAPWEPECDYDNVSRKYSITVAGTKYTIVNG